jgi:hypothetical protein
LALSIGEPLGATTWGGFAAINHAQVFQGEELLGILLRLDLPQTKEDGFVIPASTPYRFEPIDGNGLPVMACLNSGALLAELELKCPVP